MRKKTVTKKLLSILLCLALSIGTVYVPGVVSEAKTEKKQSVKRAGTVETTALKADNNSAATVDSTVVDASLLFSHTEKSSELKDGDAPSNGVENAGLTSSKDVYNELGFNSSELQKNVEDIQTDPNNQNVLAGYTLVDPKEVVLLKTKDYNTTIDTIDDEAFNLSGSMKWEKAADQLKYSRDTSLQSEAVKLMDVDGDGIDELIRQRIFVKDKKTWMDLYGFRMINGSWSTQGEPVTYQLSTGTGNWQDKFWTDEKGGYTSMAAGDFDGDEKGEELAVYVPGDATMPDSERARVVILKWNTSLSGVTELGKINMSSIKSYYMDMKSGYHAPSVSLQATHSRLKSEIPDESKSFTRWSTYTDLVVNATVPPAYRKNSSIPSLNATTTIYSYDKSKGMTKVMDTYEWKPFNDDGYKRMTCINTCDADLNGDGFDEIVVAGYREEMKDSSSTSYGDYTRGVNCVSVINSNKNGGYSVGWSKPKSVVSDTNTNKGQFNPNHVSAPEPIALCAGHFDATTPSTFDQIYVMGAVIGVHGTKITGIPTEEEKSDGKNISYCAIPDTLPYKNESNLPEGEVTFETLFAPYSEENHNVMMINQAVAGKFNTGLETDTIISIYSYRVGSYDNKTFYVDVIGYFPDEGGWKINSDKAVTRGMKDADETDDATSIAVAIGDVEDDAFYYKYIGTSTSYTAPELYAVMQQPPYYDEVNSASPKVTLTSGSSGGLTGSVGISLGVSASVKAFAAEAGMSGGAGYTFAHSKTVTKTETHIFMPPSNIKGDWCVVFAIPILLNNYDVIRPSTGERETESFYEALTPTFSTLSLEDYNKAVDKYLGQGDKGIPKDSSMQKIDLSVLPPSKAGDPTLYSKDAPNISSSDFTSGMIEDTITPTSASGDHNIAFQVADSFTNTGNISWGFSVGFELLGNEGKVTQNATMSGSIVTTSTKGVTMGVSYNPLSLPVNVTMLDDAYTAGNHITHGNATLSNYSYTSKAVARPLNTLISGYKPDTVFIMSYYTDGWQYMPEQPSAVELKSLEESKDDDGSDQVDVTLMWRNTQKNPQRKGANVEEIGYNIYESDRNYPNYLHLVNKEGIIRRTTASEYSEYTIRYKQGQWNDAPTYYVVPAWKDASGAVIEGVAKESTVVNIEKTIDSPISIAKNITSYSMKQTDDAETAEFVLDLKRTDKAQAYMNGSEYQDIKVTWQERKVGGSWEDVETQTAKVTGDDDYDTKSFSHSITLGDRASKDAYDDATVRAMITYGNYSIRSATVYVEYAGKTMVSGNLKYKKNGNGTVRVEGVKNSKTKKSIKKISIPATIENNGRTYKVTEIKKGAFKNVKKLKTVIIGKNIRKIGKGAFSGTKKLKKLTIKSIILKKALVKHFLHKSYVNKLKVPKSVLKKYKKFLTKKHLKARGKLKVTT